MPELAFPYRIAGTGRTATAADHVRELIEQVLFTSPGERVMRPDFGSALNALVFEPNSAQLATTTQFLAQASLQQHLSHLIAVRSVAVEPRDAALVVTVEYTLLADGSAQVASLRAPGAAP